jgi:nucleoside-diphosphate-sugar epimerase
MARVLVVGCGCRGRALASALIDTGHAVRGTTRSETALRAIEAVGAEAAAADPGRLSTLMPQLEGIGVLCWLMGTAIGTLDAVADLHGPRLESMLQAIVDAPVRGVVYEGAGSVPPGLLEQGAAIARRAERAHMMPVEVTGQAPGAHAEWLAEALAAIERILGR